MKTHVLTLIGILIVTVSCKQRETEKTEISEQKPATESKVEKEKEVADNEMEEEDKIIETYNVESIDESDDESKSTNTESSNLIKPGKHSFTLQWIGWDHPGSVTITKKGENTYYVKGQQLSRENNDYIKIDGTLKPLSKKELIFNGTIKYLVSYNNNGQECVKSGRQVFKASGNRKYWRLQNMINCDKVVTDYIDIYFN